MTTDVIDLRKGERFLVVGEIAGTFGATDITLLNVALAGVQVANAQPLRIGTRARLTFSYGNVEVEIAARVLWSQLSQSHDASGKLLYKTGMKIEAADPQYGVAVNALFKAGAIQRDTESLERKRQRQEERERRLSTAKMRVIPPPTSSS